MSISNIFIKSEFSYQTQIQYELIILKHNKCPAIVLPNVNLFTAEFIYEYECFIGLYFAHIKEVLIFTQYKTVIS